MKQPETDFTAGQEIFKDYRYRGYLGKGGYGTVYHVQNAAGVSFALKVLQEGLEMEQQGFEAVRSVSSIRLVRVLDHGKTAGGKPCFLMEYVKESLASVLERTPKLEEKRACAYFTEILKGLQVLEDNGIIHRDIKPANLFVVEDIVKIGDFGSAKFTSGDCSSMSRAPGSIHYMAPERFKKGYGFSVDRWAAAVIFYEMLTGKHIFDGDDDTEVFGAIMQGDPDLSLVPSGYQPFVDKCFKPLEQRHGNSREMLDAFQRGISTKNDEGNPDPVKEESEHETDQKKNRKKVLAVIAGLLIVIASVALVAGQLRFRSESRLKESIAAKPTHAITAKSQKPEPAEAVSARLFLRREPATVSEAAFKKVFGLDDGWRPLEYIDNDYVDNHDGTVTDRATGLTWQQSGSKKNMNYDDAGKYVAQLNRDRFAGHSDWRLPTVPELMSLIEPKELNDGLYIDPVFDKNQSWCWSADREARGGAAWDVYFNFGKVYWYNLDRDFNYVRAVRP